MIEKPNLSDDVLISSLNTQYDLKVKQIDFLPIGNDSTAWVYKVFTANSDTYFLKVKRGAIAASSVLLPHHLYEAGLKQVVAPVPNMTNALSTQLNDFTLILYPYVSDDNAMDVGMSLEDWAEYGKVVQHIHATELTAKITQHVPRETFTLNPRWMRIIQSLQSAVAQATHPQTAQQELADFWQAQHEVIAQLVERTTELGRRCQQQSLTFVLCHADIHTANILLDEVGKLFVVDWDQPIIAPKERDLMFVVGGQTTPENEQAFLKGYGSVEIDWLALAYYRYEWVVQEFADYGERVFFSPDAGQATQEDAVLGFKQLFLPGDVVDVAYACEAYLI